MPTLTRFAAMLLFGVLSYFIGIRYLQLYEDPPDTLAGSVFLALVAAFVGWNFVGPRIGRSFLRGFAVVVQGYLATLLLALFLYGFYDAFTKGYARQYRDLSEAVQGVIGAAIEHLQRMSDIAFLTYLLVVALGIAVVVTIVYRAAEARRLAR